MRIEKRKAIIADPLCVRVKREMDYQQEEIDEKILMQKHGISIA